MQERSAGRILFEKPFFDIPKPPPTSLGEVIFISD